MYAKPTLRGEAVFDGHDMFDIRCKVVLALIALSGGTLWGGVDARFTAPRNERQLAHRINQLRAHYGPFLRSLPEKLPARDRVSLNGRWRFSFEVKDPPGDTKGIPPAPPWYAVNCDDSAWETTTVPEWRYRTRGHDNAYDLKSIDKWLGYTGDRTTSQICWYRRTFTANPPPSGQRLWLCFDGVDWEAQVYLNGELLGSHRVYYEPFRFDVTGKIRSGRNVLAVRVIDGRQYGEPMSYWATFPDIRARQQRYTPDRSRSIIGHLPIGYHCGTGFGIWRDVYLEQTGPVRIDAILARNDLSDSNARIRVGLDSSVVGRTHVDVAILPENFAFMDVVLAFWPKAIVGHDHRPKKAYYQLAQINQPVLPLARFAGDRPEATTLWAVNDLSKPFSGATVRWTVASATETLLRGEQRLEVPALGVAEVRTIDLTPVTEKHATFRLSLTLLDRAGRTLSRYQRRLRYVPKSLLRQ